jgi:sugar phosphate isomerase/epimerase
MKTLLPLFATLLISQSVPAAPEPVPASTPLFAMDTAARGGPSLVVPLLKELGYAGLGGQAGDAVMPGALEQQGLRFFNAYHVTEIDLDHPEVGDQLTHFIDLLQGHDSALWLGLSKVKLGGASVPGVDSVAEQGVVEKLRALADYAGRRGVKIALYPHTGLWLDRVEQSLRIADKVDRPALGMTFNLCHWLRVEGIERDPGPVLAAARPRLMFVTINGADAGDTKKLGWDRLIQPLGEGSYDVRGFLAKVKAAGFAGPIGFQGYAIKLESRELLTRTMRAWRDLQGVSPP